LIASIAYTPAQGIIKPMSTNNKILYGFHDVGVRLKTTASCFLELHIDVTRRDARMKQFQERAKETVETTPCLKLIEFNDAGLISMCGGFMDKGSAESLNVFVARAVSLYEAVSQRT
jgi:23S rRNA (guanosine2251-2'-O)-methyltransferase